MYLLKYAKIIEIIKKIMDSKDFLIKVAYTKTDIQISKP